MHYISIALLVGCAAVASAQTFVNPQLRQTFGKQQNIPKINPTTNEENSNNKNGPNHRQQQSYVVGANNGINPLFNGENPQGGQLSYNFKQDFKTLISPRNDKSDWRWARSSPAEEYVADGGTFLSKGFSSIDLVSLPFHKFISSKQGRLAGLSGYEAVLVNRQNFTVEEGKKLTLRVSFACHLFNEEQSPYPNMVVSNEEDDPTLANCAISLGSYGDSSLVFSIVSSDEGIWAVCERNRFELNSHPERNDRAFTLFHKIGKRSSVYEIIDGGIEYDRETNRVNYLINNEVVYHIGNIGQLPHSVNGTTVYTKDRPDLVKVVEPSMFQVWIGLTDYLDVYDPNSKNPGISNQRLVDGNDYYDPKATFYDEVGKRENSLWGQGGVMTLYDALIKLENGGGGNSRHINTNQ